MSQLTLWQKLEFIEELFGQIAELQKQIETLEISVQNLKTQKMTDLEGFEIATKNDLRKQKYRENFLNELLQKQNQEKEVFNQIVNHIDTVIDSRLSDTSQFAHFNINPSNPKEIEIVKKALKQRLLSKV